MGDQSTSLNLTNGQQALLVGGIIVVLAVAYLLVLMITRAPGDIRKMMEDDDNV